MTTTATAATRPSARSNSRTAGPSAKATTIASASGTKIACARERTATIKTTVPSAPRPGRSARDAAAGACCRREAALTDVYGSDWDRRLGQAPDDESQRDAAPIHPSGCDAAQWRQLVTPWTRRRSSSNEAPTRSRRSAISVSSRAISFCSFRGSLWARREAQAMRASDDLVLSDRAAMVRCTSLVTSAPVRSRMGVRRSAATVR